MNQVPPHDFGAEGSLLSACMLSTDAVHAVLELEVSKDTFYDRRHQGLYAGVLNCFERNVTVDLTTLKDALTRLGSLEECGGILYMAEVYSMAATGANVRHHAGILIDLYQRRRLIEIAADTDRQARDMSREAEETAETVERELETLVEAETGGFETLGSILHEVSADTETAYQSGGSSVPGLDTGFTDLNGYTSGFHPGDLILLAGRPSQGKTALALGIARNVPDCNDDAGVAILSLEMSKKRLTTRFVASQAGINSQKIRRGRLSGEEWERLTETFSRLAQLPIYIDDTSSLSPQQARARVRELDRKHPLGLVIVDYLQLMHVPGAGVGERTQEVGIISRGLKRMAGELNVPVLALSQLSRDIEKTGRRPQLSDLRDSGSLEQDADVVLFIYHPHESGKKRKDSDDSLEGIAEIIVAKQRDGPKGSVLLQWEPEFTRFANAELHKQEQAV